MYTEHDLVRIAQRENNKKRNYLVVNPLQGKHIPASPQKALEMFSQLAKLLEVYDNEKILIVGFAETATAIGAQVAITLGADYIQTTREDMGDVTYFYFSEEHSHATQQKLVRDDIDKIIAHVNRIIFAEDEITTGKTILNMISVMEQWGNDSLAKINFSVVSLLNGMTEEAMNVYQNRGIGIHYLVKTQHTKYPQIAEKAINDGVYYGKNVSEAAYTACFTIKGALDSRRLVHSNEYAAACGKLFEEISRCIPLPEEGKILKEGKILILGTEEFMFPGLYVGKCLEETGYDVRFHATTRSPIHVSRNREYPLHERYELTSFYEKDRNTFIYDIGSYDIVIVITDGQETQKEGEYSLLHAVRKHNEKVYLVRWQP